ncbi:DUF4167 domain-containing protein [Amaricoccus sp. W119]|uniref:DUF4167 domain-containing protein n=1 Tax=Amaricoccus sp. W119 TaxID=3391833 RepID=UPI0039A4369A
MRSSNKSRSRNKAGNNGQNNQRRPMGNIVNRVFESAGPDGKVRGTPQQIIDKYQALARDAQVAGDRVAAENYLQHSEHYSRLLGEAQRQQNEQRFGQDQREDASRGGDDQPAERGGERAAGGGGERPREQQNGQPAPRARQVQGFGLQTIDPEDSEFGLIPTPENSERRARTSGPASDYQSSEAIGGDPRDEAPDAGSAAETAAPRAAEAAEPVAPAPVAETRTESAPETTAAPETTIDAAVEAGTAEGPAEAVSEAPAAQAAEQPGEPAPEEAAPPKRTRARRKPKAETGEKPARKSTKAAKAEAAAASEGGSEAQPADTM